MVRTSTSALRVRIYLLLMNCKLALRRNLHYAGFRQYSTHVIKGPLSSFHSVGAPHNMLVLSRREG